MPEKNKISKVQQKAVHKYVKNNYDRIELTIKPKGKKEELKAHAEKNGETLNSFINRAIDEAIERDNLKLSSAASINHPPSLEATSPKKYNKHLTKTEADQINLQELLTNFKYQIAIADAYGTDVLSSLLEQARQQAAENKISDA